MKRIGYKFVNTGNLMVFKRLVSPYDYLAGQQPSQIGFVIQQDLRDILNNYEDKASGSIKALLPRPRL